MKYGEKMESLQPLSSIADLLRVMEAHSSSDSLLYEKVGKAWVGMSQGQMREEIKALSLWLLKIGVQKGEKIGILADPSPRWTIVDLACMAVGAVTVPLFGNISEENFVFECTQAEIALIFVSGSEQFKMWHRQKKLFSRTVALDEIYDKASCIPYEIALEIGQEELVHFPQAFEDLLHKIHPDDLATIIYTSGSTGIPKGVMLNSRALVCQSHIDPMLWDPAHDRYLSILPLAHVFGRSMNFIMLHWGIPIFYFNDLKNIGTACQEIHPTVTALVPRLLEKIYAKMVATVDREGFLKRTIGHWAFSLATEETERLYKTLMHPLADKIVYAHLREALGGSLRVVISGGAPLNPHLCHFFIDIGLPIYEGYGLTEASIVSVNTPQHLKIGTVGQKLTTMQVKLSPEGEILLKGGIVLTGYYKHPKATAEAIDAEGWFHTGDKGLIDEEGFITIVGRIKELVKSSTGEYIAPVPIEQQLCKAPFIDLALVIADRRKYVSALIFPNFEVIHSLKKSLEMDRLSDEEFLNSSTLKSKMQKLIESVNSRLNHWEQIREYRFAMIPPTIESGELTPSMKLKREVVMEKYKNLIASMYPEEDYL